MRVGAGGGGGPAAYSGYMWAGGPAAYNGYMSRVSPLTKEPIITQHKYIATQLKSPIVV